MLRPIDIQNKEFEKKLKGYNCDEVDDFLDVVIQDYELLCKENQTLKDKIGLLTETVERYKQMENTMQKSIDIAKNAETEANAIISKAKLDASYLARQIDDEHMKRHQEMLSLKGEIEQYKMQIKSLCANVMKMVDNID